MALTVLKFGGSSLAGRERLIHAAETIRERHGRGEDVIAVVSARGDLTDRLLREARELTETMPLRERDLLISTGEQIAAAEVSAVLNLIGCPATALTGWQAGIRTDDRFGDARVLGVAETRLRAELAAGRTAVVTGFQGMTDNGEITTLGRGGSDTTAVALAVFLHADECRILTDVDGVYTADPRIVPNARKLNRISCADMLELARLGARVLHSRSAELALAHGPTFEIASSLHGEPGTKIVPEEGNGLSGVAVMPWDSGSAVSLVGTDCEEAESAFREALTPFAPHRIVRSERSLTALLADPDAQAAACCLHRRFFEKQGFSKKKPLTE